VGEGLAEPDQLSYLAPLARQLAAAARQLPVLAQAYRTGHGVSWAEFGADMRESEAELNRPAYLSLLGDWLGALPGCTTPTSAPPPGTDPMTW
jgi:hypothetical protein